MYFWVGILCPVNPKSKNLNNPKTFLKKPSFPARIESELCATVYQVVQSKLKSSVCEHFSRKIGQILEWSGS